ncbi:MAG: inositol monophosphatase [Gammaproteobacteria bacterium]|nr:inositol monophosphatase [Gammaproteobacteria bacterium]
MYDPILNIAIEAARHSGNTIMRAFNRLDRVQVGYKSPNDLVTEIDKRVEKDIIATIQKAYPSHGILGEEGTEIVGDDYQWIIDPIDGTRNFVHGFPYFAISIGVMHKNKLEYGVIYDPIHQELFTAARGKGARLNDRRIRVSSRKSLEECLLGTGFAYRHKDPENPLPQAVLQAILPTCGDVRRLGAAALDLAYVACGRLDCFWEMGLHLWDIAAGILLIKEAGGIVSDLSGSEDYLKTGNVVGANPIILRQFLKTIHPQMEESKRP